jgi:hypothetical protein
MLVWEFNPTLTRVKGVMGALFAIAIHDGVILDGAYDIIGSFYAFERRAPAR